MAGALDLYPAQKAGVQRFLAHPAHRMILAYGTGCGKTPTAIRAVAALLSQDKAERGDRPARILVLCPAIVRRHWTHEFRRWADLTAHPIEMGRDRRSGSKAARAARDAAYRADVQVSSYDLAAQIDGSGWDAIIFDEIHHLADATSKQSRAARFFMRQNEGVPALGLSATLIPTELWQLWHPLHLLFGDAWGRPPKAGKISWQFVSRYCEIERNEYGAAPGALKADAAERLRRELAPHVHRLTREDIASDLPPIDLSVLDVPGARLDEPTLAIAGKAPRVRPEVEHAIEWYKALENDVTHAAVLVYHREIAKAMAEALRPHLGTDTLCLVIDGSIPTAARVSMLDSAAAAPRCMVIITTESIREGIRLMWADKVLLAEWRQSPKQVIQVLGRFNSVGDGRRPHIQVLSDESLYGQSRKLLSRMSAVNAVLKKGGAEQAVESTFDFSAPTSDHILERTMHLIMTGPRDGDSDWQDQTEDDDDAW